MYIGFNANSDYFFSVYHRSIELLHIIYAMALELAFAPDMRRRHCFFFIFITSNL